MALLKVSLVGLQFLIVTVVFHTHFCTICVSNQEYLLQLTTLCTVYLSEQLICMQRGYLVGKMTSSKIISLSKSIEYVK